MYLPILVSRGIDGVGGIFSPVFDFALLSSVAGMDLGRGYRRPDFSFVLVMGSLLMRERRFAASTTSSPSRKRRRGVSRITWLRISLRPMLGLRAKSNGLCWAIELKSGMFRGVGASKKDVRFAPHDRSFRQTLPVLKSRHSLSKIERLQRVEWMPCVPHYQKWRARPRSVQLIKAVLNLRYATTSMCRPGILCPCGSQAELCCSIERAISYIGINGLF